MELYYVPALENDCYKAGRPHPDGVRGIMWHSTGVNNNELRRYVQPVPVNDSLFLGWGDSERVVPFAEMMEILGDNIYNNDWCTNARPGGRSVCVHAFIGEKANGGIATCQILPWEMRGWHSGSGENGQANNQGYIGFEIQEDAGTDPVYLSRAYREAVELSAMLCNRYGLDPMQDGVVIDHAEGHDRGIASNHGDVASWFSRHGRTMSQVRRDIREEMDMTQERFNELFEAKMRELRDNDAGEWSLEARQWAVESGLFEGDNGNFMWEAPMTREMAAVLLKRYTDMLQG